ncbi:methyltransferase family protein [Kribbella sp. VKM Ac-2527]|uniref:Methyltransferase family protein n=1 Tax=Kribbella caucasensis TaxID=2512215 RepID=A0A4R6K693_9ACTN|nr:class I SAM-dependent methyltransferase [Kribbella sp. VKM Ac-2527]TDO43346.1 methyltransferase family protein [Kribbella sp. VKM Ac-2527]
MSTLSELPVEQIEETPTPSAAGELSGRLFGQTLGAVELVNVYLGVELGLYRSLTEDGPATPAELAERTGIDVRYAQDWLAQQAVTGLLTARGDEPSTALFSPADGVRETLVDEISPFYVGGMTYIAPSVGRALPSLVAAFRTGGGVPYAAYGPEAVTAQGALNRPAYENSLIDEWLPQVPDIQARLADTARPARVADLGAGVGWSSIRLAEAFPHIRVDGYDLDEESIARGRRYVAERGVADRVDLEVADITQPLPGGGYDLAVFFECLHDLPHPVAALEVARRSLAPGGSVIVMEEHVAESFTAPGDEVERFMAAAGTIWCVPQGRIEADSEVVGPLDIRPAVMRRLAERAGFDDVEILPIEHPFWRFYRLDVRS